MTSNSTVLIATPAEAWSAVLTHWSLPLTQWVVTPLCGAPGRVTAREVTSPCDSPSFERAAMDGYALPAAAYSGAGTPAVVRVIGEVCLGQAADLTLTSGEADWTATGGMIPPGADAVINVEHTTTISGYGSAVGPASPGDNIVPQGADFRWGDRELEAGRCLHAQDVAMPAGLGLAEAEVMRRPRVAILISGDDLRLPGQCLAPGEIYPSKRYALAALNAALG